MFLFKSSGRPSWDSYLLSGLVSGTAALVVSWALTGCRLGNHVENPPAPAKQYAFFDATAKTLTYTATLAAAHSVNAPLSLIPANIADAMSDPVALIWTDPGNDGDAFLTNNSGQGSAIPVVAHQDGSLLMAGQSSAQTLWLDSTCTVQLFLDEGGSFSTYKTPTVSTNGLPVTGRVTLDLTMTHLLDGPCTTSLQAMRACYMDVTACGGADTAENVSLQTYVFSMFKSYIDAGVMVVNDIPDVRALTFEITYE